MGFEIPFFKEAKELVLQAAGNIPGLRIVGWDVAIAESGPVLIEGNSNYDTPGSELSGGGYRSNVTFRKVLQELGYLMESSSGTWVFDSCPPYLEFVYYH